MHDKDKDLRAIKEGRGLSKSNTKTIYDEEGKLFSGIRIDT